MSTMPPPTGRDRTPEERLLILDAWEKSGLAATDFAPLVGLTSSTLYAWKKAAEGNRRCGRDAAEICSADQRLRNPVSPFPFRAA